LALAGAAEALVHSDEVLPMTRLHRKLCSVAFSLLCSLGLTSAAVGQFETGSTTALGVDPFSLATGDFNQDGNVDVAVTNGGLIQVYLGNGDGTFQAPTTYTTDLSLAYSIAAADLNGDGKLDLVATSAGTKTVEVFLGKGDGTFQSPLTSNTTAGAYYVTVGDFNNDHKLDLALVDYPYASVLLGNGDGTFQPPFDVMMPFSPITVGLGDFNRDGNLDIAVSGDGNSGETMILLGNGDGTLREGWSYSYGSAPDSTAVADFRGIGLLDLAVADEFGDIAVFLGNGDGTFGAPVFYTSSFVTWIAAADLNGDGRPDLVAANVGTPNNPLLGTVSVLLGNGDGTFQPETVYPTGISSRFVAVGDFNGDQRLDIADADNTNWDLVVLLNTGLVNFSPTTPIAFPSQLLNRSSSAQSVRMTNAGTSALTISSISVTAPFHLSAKTTCKKGQLAAGASCHFAVTFKPTTTGAAIGTVAIVDSASSKPQVIELSGQGTVVSLAPNPLNFPTQKVGTKKSLPVQLTNDGSTALTVSGVQITGANAKDFSETDNCTTQTIAPGAGCTITVTFDPVKTGLRKAAVSVTDTGGGSPQQVTLTGTGN
jgi:hypothetical protein